MKIVIFQNRSWGLSEIDLLTEFGHTFYTYVMIRAFETPPKICPGSSVQFGFLFK